MVNATVDNKPVSIQLDPGESTTVPSNETWKVQLTLSIRDASNGSDGNIDINGTNVIGGGDGGGRNGQVAPETVVTGTDTISLANGKGASISGFVVDS